MYRRTFALFISVLAVVAVVAGCGDDENTSSLTKAEFAKQADAKCKDLNEAARNELGAYLQKNAEGGFPSKEQEVELVTTVVVPLFQKQVEALNDLGIPEDDNGEIAEFVEEVEGVLEEAEDDPNATISGGAPFDKAEELGKPLGIEECGHN